MVTVLTQAAMLAAEPRCAGADGLPRGDEETAEPLVLARVRDAHCTHTRTHNTHTHARTLR